MLFPGGESEHVAHIAVHVVGLPHDAARELAEHGLVCGHIAQVRPTEGKVQPQGLGLAHGHVRAALAGGLHDRQGDGVTPHDVLGPGGVDALADGFRILDAAEEVGLLDIDAGDVRAQRGLEGLHIRAPVPGGDHLQLRAGAEAVGAHDGDGLGIRAGGDQGLVPFPVPAHGQGLGGGGGAVVDGGVGDLHARQGANHGLILKNRLQNALADLRLIGGVGGDQLLAADDALHHGGDEVAVCPRAPEDGAVDPVLGGHGLQGPADLQFTEALR